MNRRDLIKSLAGGTSLISLPTLSVSSEIFTEPHSAAMAIHDSYPPSTAKNPEVVNIIAWWGYLNHPVKIYELEQLCQAKIAVTEYHSTEELLALIANKFFDIFIYPQNLLHEALDSIAIMGPDLKNIAEGYVPFIRDRYFASNLAQDTLYYQLDTNVLIYDQSAISNIENLAVKDIFSIAEQNTGRVVLQNNFAQLDWLLKQSEQHQRLHYWDWLRDLVTAQGAQLSDYVSAYYQSDLVLGYLDAGEAYRTDQPWAALKDAQGRPKKMALALHPRFSHVSCDLISVKSEKPAAIRVGREMASREFLAWTAQTSLYFSPFGEVPVHADGQPISAVARDYLHNVQYLHWLDDNDFSDISADSLRAQRIWRQIPA